MVKGFRIAFESMLRGGVEGREWSRYKPRTELILMIRPAFCCRMIGRTALVVRITPKRFTSNNAWAWFIENSSAPASRPVPALLTRTSILPVVSSTLSTAVFTDVSSVTSQVTIVIPLRVPATARRLVPNTGIQPGAAPLRRLARFLMKPRSQSPLYRLVASKAPRWN